jgi:hypothetical protein
MPTARTAEGDAGPGYERHRPEQTLLYQIIEQHYPDFLSAMEAQDRPLPGYVQDEFEAFLQCGRLEQGFLRQRCYESLTCRLNRSLTHFASINTSICWPTNTGRSFLGKL